MAHQSGIRVEPIADEPAATIDLGSERAVVIGDYHAGIEAGLRYEHGVELPSNSDERRERLCSLLDTMHADRLVVLGDLGHRIGQSRGVEREELTALYGAVVEDRGIAITVAPGNHDGEIESVFGDREGVEMLPMGGGLLGTPPDAVGVFHGHTWPAHELLSAQTICMAHEHPQVKLQDSVGGSRTEKAWLRGRLNRERLARALDGEPESVDSSLDSGGPELVVFPAFNDRSGGTWVNVEGQGFLAPFLPDTLTDASLYLLDGTRLGAYQHV